MAKNFGKALGVLTVMLAVFAMILGCPTPGDPWRGDLTGGPQERPVVTPPLPEAPEAVIYDVRLGRFVTSDEGTPGRTLEAAVPGTIFFGEEVVASDATGLSLSLRRVIPEDGAAIEWGFSSAPAIEPADFRVFDPADAVHEGTIPTGSFLIIRHTVPDGDDYLVTFHNYLVIWGQDGTGIESITIGGRMFRITGLSSIGGTETGFDGITTTSVFLTNAQIAAGRPIEVVMRGDSQRAQVFWQHTTANNDNPPTGNFSPIPPGAAFANNHRIWIRVRSRDGSSWANYRIQVVNANQAVMGTLTTARASTTPGAAGLGTPAGSWDSGHLASGLPISIKNTRLLNNNAVHTGGTAVSSVTWAFVPDIDTEPNFLPLTDLFNFSFGGYIYVRVVGTNANYLNIYRFPVVEEPLSDDPYLTAVWIGGALDPNVEIGTPGEGDTGWSTAVAGAPFVRFIANVTPPVITAIWADDDADTEIMFTRRPGGSTAAPPPVTATPPNLEDGDELFIRSRSEDTMHTRWYKFIYERQLSSDARITAIHFADSPASLGTPNADEALVTSGSVILFSDWTAASTITVDRQPSSTIQFAYTATADGVPAWGPNQPAAGSIEVDGAVWFRVTAEDESTTLVYRVVVTGTRAGRHGRGVSDPEWKAANPWWVFPGLGPYELLTDYIGSNGMPIRMPPVSHWASVPTPAGPGHLHGYPDPFRFANGNRVTNIADWENRRLEIQAIIGYYMKGFVPSLDSRLVDVWLSGPNNTTINLRHRPSGRTLSHNAVVTANAAATVSGNEGRLGISSFLTGTSAVPVAGVPNMVMAVTLPNFTEAQINTFYGITQANSTSRDSRAAWNASVMLIAIEGTSDPVLPGGARQNEEQFFFPISMAGTANPMVVAEGDRSWFTTKGAMSSAGTSTGGKLSMAHATLSSGRKPGTRFGWVHIMDAGAMGPAIERFTSMAGLRLDVSAQEALRLSGFSEEYITRYLGRLPDNSAGLGPRMGHAATLLGPNRTPGFYNVNPDGTLKMGQFSVGGQALEVRGWQPYGWPVAIAPINHPGLSSRANAGSLGGTEDTWGIPWFKIGIRGHNQTTNLYYGTSLGGGGTLLADRWILHPDDAGQRIPVVTTMTSGEWTGMPPYQPAADMRQHVRRLRTVRGWAPYFEDFNNPPQSSTNRTQEFPLPGSEDYIEIPYTAWFSMIDGQQNPNWVAGHETFVNMVQGTGADWVNFVLRQFPVLHSIHQWDYPGTTTGFLCSLPADTYMQLMMQAPYGVIVHAFPTMQARTNDLSVFAAWVITDEIFKMYGEARGSGLPCAHAPAGSGLYDGWDTFLFNNMLDAWWGNHAGMETVAQPNMHEARGRWLYRGTGVATTVEEARADIRIARFRDPYFQIDDPHSYIGDFHKIHISRPRPCGAPGVPISERVSRRVAPVLHDFFMGSIYHAPPARYPLNRAATFHNAAREAMEAGTLVLDGPRFRPMDWRGLLAVPEPLP